MNVTTLEQDAVGFKAADTVQTGLRTLEFYAAAFSKEPDANGDIIDPHAFDAWLKAFYAEGKPLPISFSHAAVRDAIDPTNVIGYAPADPAHVWVDDFGLRVKSYIDTSSEKGKAVEWQIENKLVGGASIAYEVPAGARVKSGRGTWTINEAWVMEAGPTPNPANQQAVLLWMKEAGMLSAPTDLPYMTVEEFRATFEKVTATETETVTETKHATAPAALQAAHNALVKAGAKCAPGEVQEKTTDDDPTRQRLRRLGLMKAGITR